MAEESRTYQRDPDTIFQCALSGCSKSDFTVTRIHDAIRRIEMSTPASWLSYGEKIEVIVQPENEADALVYVKSVPKFLFNVTGEEVAKKNIHAIYQIIDQELNR